MQNRNHTSASTSNRINYCKFCAGNHQRGKCPAYGQKYNSCHKKNYFARCCKKRVYEIHETDDTSSDSDSEFVMDFIGITNKDPNLIKDFR